MTRLRKMMLEKLQRRNYSAVATRNYLRVVTEFAKYFGKSPDKLGPNEQRTYKTSDHPGVYEALPAEIWQPGCNVADDLKSVRARTPTSTKVTTICTNTTVTTSSGRLADNDEREQTSAAPIDAPTEYSVSELDDESSERSGLV